MWQLSVGPGIVALVLLRVLSINDGGRSPHISFLIQNQDYKDINIVLKSTIHFPNQSLHLLQKDPIHQARVVTLF